MHYLRAISVLVFYRITVVEVITVTKSFFDNILSEVMKNIVTLQIKRYKIAS